MKMRFHTRLAAAVVALGAVMAFAPVQAEQVFGAQERRVHDVARMGTAQEMKAILEARPAARDERGGLGLTPLHLAATNPDAGPLKELLAAGADVNAKDDEGMTPLHWAAYSSKPQTTKLLLEAGAEVNVKASAGRTALSLARKARADEVAGLISIWVLKGCKAGGNCEQATTTDLKKLVD